ETVDVFGVKRILLPIIPGSAGNTCSTSHVLLVQDPAATVNVPALACMKPHVTRSISLFVRSEPRRMNVGYPPRSQLQSNTSETPSGPKYTPPSDLAAKSTTAFRALPTAGRICLNFEKVFIA